MLDRSAVLVRSRSTYNGISDRQLTANLYCDAAPLCPLPDARFFFKTPLARLKPQYGTDQATGGIDL
jgi:hypothetical protein